eukprot:Skav205807  [mRNA]  locus=scaffold307:288410:290966:+ [translate_table: standard]
MRILQMKADPLHLLAGGQQLFIQLPLDSFQHSLCKAPSLLVVLPAEAELQRLSILGFARDARIVVWT